jgi:hypothetical protein
VVFSYVPKWLHEKRECCIAPLFGSDRLLVGSPSNAGDDAFTSGFIRRAIRNQNRDSESTPIGQCNKPHVVGGGGDASMSPGAASLVREGGAWRKPGT